MLGLRYHYSACVGCAFQYFYQLTDFTKCGMNFMPLEETPTV